MIILIIENITNRVIYTGGTLTDSGYIGEGVRAPNVNTENSRAVEVESLPEDFIQGASTYNEIDDVWEHPTEGGALENKLSNNAEGICAEINRKRDEIFFAGVDIPNTEHSLQFRGMDDFMRLSTLMDAIRDGAPSVQVIVESNEMPSIDAADFTAAWQAGMQRNSQASLNARNLKNQVIAASSISAQNAIDIEYGWPE